jgi:DNA-binding NarL/FixJ family response regulator
LPDPIARSWIDGRRVGIGDAVAEALAVDLGGPAASDTAAKERPPTPDARAVLTYREQEVLALLCQRLTDAEIGNRLFLSKRTVEHHVSSILGKLGVANRRQAAAFAVRYHLV